MDKYIRDDQFIKAFGSKVRTIRKSQKMSMVELAFQAEIEYSQLSRIERGEINTSISVVNAIAKALNISPKDLFDF